MESVGSWGKSRGRGRGVKKSGALSQNKHSENLLLGSGGVPCSRESWKVEEDPSVKIQSEQMEGLKMLGRGRGRGRFLNGAIPVRFAVHVTDYHYRRNKTVEEVEPKEECKSEKDWKWRDGDVMKKKEEDADNRKWLELEGFSEFEDDSIDSCESDLGERDFDGLSVVAVVGSGADVGDALIYKDMDEHHTP